MPVKRKTSDLKQLRAVLNQTGTSIANNPLYQFCNELLNRLSRNEDIIFEHIKELQIKAGIKPTGEAPPDGSSEGGVTPEPEPTPDYVTVVDGASPVVQNIDDGSGESIKIPYDPVQRHMQ